jgi:hypothetical protein
LGSFFILGSSQINKLPAMNHLQEEEETPAIAFAAIPEDSSRDIEKGRGRAGLVAPRPAAPGQQVGCCNTK